MQSSQISQTLQLADDEEFDPARFKKKLEAVSNNFRKHLNPSEKVSYEETPVVVEEISNGGESQKNLIFDNTKSAINQIRSKYQY